MPTPSQELPHIDDLRTFLERWADTLPVTKLERIELVELTITRACEDPARLQSEPIDAALVSLMRQVLEDELIPKRCIRWASPDGWAWNDAALRSWRSGLPHSSLGAGPARRASLWYPWRTRRLGAGHGTTPVELVITRLKTCPSNMVRLYLLIKLDSIAIKEHA